MFRRICLSLLCAFVLVSTGADPVFAHGVAALPGQDQNIAWLRNVMFIAVAATAVVLLRITSKARRWSDDAVARQHPFVGVTRALGLAFFVFVAWLAFGGATVDPFNSAVRSFSELWFLLPIGSALFGAYWCVVSPALVASSQPVGDTAMRPLAGAGVVVWLWFWLTYIDARSSSAVAVAMLVYALIIVVLRVTRGFEFVAGADPFVSVSRTMAGLAPYRISTNGFRFIWPGARLVNGWQAPIYIVVPMLAAVLFEAMEDQTFWINLITNYGGWWATSLRTLGLLGVITGVGLIVSLTAVVTSYFGQTSFKNSLTWMSRSLVPLIFAFFLAHDMFPFVTALQEQLFVAWDPLGRGWQVFGSSQGLTIDLVGNYLGVLQNVALTVGVVLAMVVAHGQLRRENLKSPTATAVPIFAGVIGMTYLAIVWMVPS